MEDKLAALFVEQNGVYNCANIDVWGIERDARNYSGPFKVIAHPPCERWGGYYHGGPSAKIKRKLGDDKGCFDRALWAVRTFGGVLEHPAQSKAFKYYGLGKPDHIGGWTPSLDGIGYICQVDQGFYGHAARKPTWLYMSKCFPIEMQWGKSTGKMKIEESFPTNDARKKAREAGIPPAKRISKKQLIGTPVEFMNLLIQLVRTDGR